MKKRLQKADASDATHVVFVDAQRWGAGQLELKNLATGEQLIMSGLDDQFDVFEVLRQQLITDVLNTLHSDTSVGAE